MEQFNSYSRAQTLVSLFPVEPASSPQECGTFRWAIKLKTKSNQTCILLFISSKESLALTIFYNKGFKMDSAAYAQEVKKLKPLLFSIAFKFTRDFDKAEDLFQETIIKAWGNLDKFQYGQLKPWLIKILRNLYYSSVKISEKHGGKYHFISLEHLLEDNSQFPPAVAFDWVNSSFKDDIIKAINNLPDKYRNVFYMARIEGIPHKEISALLNIPNGTVKSRIFRADNLLRKKLNNYLLHH